MAPSPCKPATSNVFPLITTTKTAVVWEGRFKPRATTLRLNEPEAEQMEDLLQYNQW